tara:strand:+ start:624 stop:866 length:243 start_codon:yes stop_codon:yes gene_type:complete
MKFNDINFTEAFKTLTDQEKRILELRYGLGNIGAHSLEQVGQELGLTRERIRQIQAKALRKLRKPLTVRKLLKIEDIDIE